MAAKDVLGAVCDRLVGGMMFHSDHADFCIYMGFKHLTKLHERGYRDDSRSLREFRALCIRRCNTFPTQGRQDRTRTLDRWRSDRTDIETCDRASALKECMRDWVEWETGTASTYRDAARRLWEMGETALSKRVNDLADETEEELAGATDLMCRLSASDWDATIA